MVLLPIFYGPGSLHKTGVGAGHFPEGFGDDGGGPAASLPVAAPGTTWYPRVEEAPPRPAPPEATPTPEEAPPLCHVTAVSADPEPQEEESPGAMVRDGEGE